MSIVVETQKWEKKWKDFEIISVNKHTYINKNQRNIGNKVGYEVILYNLFKKGYF